MQHPSQPPYMAPYPGPYHYYPGYQPQQVPPHGPQPQQVPPHGPPPQPGYYQPAQPPPYMGPPPPQHQQQHLYQPAYGHQPHWVHGPPPQNAMQPHQPQQVPPHGPPPQPGYYQPPQPPSGYMGPPQHQQQHMYQPSYGHQPHWVPGPHPQMMQHQPQQYPPHGPQTHQYSPHGPQPQQFPPHGPQPPQQIPPHPSQPQQMPQHPHPSQQIPPHPPQPQQMPHGPPQPGYYQPAQPPPNYMGPPPQHPQQPPQPQPQAQQQQPAPQPMQHRPPPQVQPQPQHVHPSASPHHPPSRTHTPQHPPASQTPTRIIPPPVISTPASPSNALKVIEKKDVITFPKNSVENTRPVAMKKRKFTCKDVSDIEVWRLLMCLKSGLLAESSWAIDVLSILLNDDATLMYFSLQNTPGLLEAVLEHFKCCLNEIFEGLVNDTTLKPIIREIKQEEVLPSTKLENGISDCNHNVKTNDNNINGISGDNRNSIGSKSVMKSKEKAKAKGGIYERDSSFFNINSVDEQITIFNSDKNYTFRTRDGKAVKLKNGVMPIQEPSYELVFKPVGYSHWQEGNGEDTSHIQVFFEPNNLIESSKRCTCLSTILRNLSFIPGNDVEMSKHAGLLLVLGRLLLLKHDLPVEPEAQPNEGQLLNSLREDSLVIISNISSSLDLSPYNDKINLSLLDGLLHWASSSSNYALDPFPVPSINVSPQRLALESLAKLSIIEGNVDLILATPPWSRVEKLFEVLTGLLSSNEEQTIREFSLVLLSNLTSADSGIARKVALTGSAIPRLISFLETSLTDPEALSTTQDMLKRAAQTLKCLSNLVDNHPLFAQHQQRLLSLVMSQKLDQEVVPIVADVIFEISLTC